MNVENYPRKESFWTSLPGILTGIAGVLAAGGTIAGLVLSSGSSHSTTTTLPTPPPATTQVAYPAGVDQNYLSACEQSSGGNSVYCQCTLNWFQNNVSYTQFLADEDMMSSGQTPEDVTSAKNSCS
jgi:hypothetical protein